MKYKRTLDEIRAACTIPYDCDPGRHSAYLMRWVVKISHIDIVKTVIWSANAETVKCSQLQPVTDRGLKAGTKVKLERHEHVTPDEVL